MWAGQHPVVDEISEILRCLFGWFRFSQNVHTLFDRPQFQPYDTSTSECLFWVIQCLRRRLGPLPSSLESDDSTRHRQGLPPANEATSFRSFILRDPPQVGSMRPLFGQSRLQEELPIQFTEEDLWDEDEVVQCDREGVPAWTETGDN